VFTTDEPVAPVEGVAVFLFEGVAVFLFEGVAVFLLLVLYSFY
jgi:hypothetical protein